MPRLSRDRPFPAISLVAWASGDSLGDIVWHDRRGSNGWRNVAPVCDRLVLRPGAASRCGARRCLRLRPGRADALSTWAWDRLIRPAATIESRRSGWGRDTGRPSRRWDGLLHCVPAPWPWPAIRLRPGPAVGLTYDLNPSPVVRTGVSATLAVDAGVRPEYLSSGGGPVVWACRGSHSWPGSSLVGC